MIPQGGTDNSERPRLNHSCPSTEDKVHSLSLCLSKERIGRRDVAKYTDLMEPLRYLFSSSNRFRLVTDLVAADERDIDL